MCASSDVFLFADFRFDRGGGGLFRRDDQGAFAPVAIGSRALDLLAALIERRGDVVSKEEIMAAVWPKLAVEEANLFVQISALRAVLDREQSGQSCIQTLAGRGYRFIRFGVGAKETPAFRRELRLPGNHAGGDAIDVGYLGAAEAKCIRLAGLLLFLGIGMTSRRQQRV